ncbi:hypothetical protein M422DRAFT_50663 [Sphaerobolus stellatus SS14]|uniref:Uncharacterized protein n=1 Tax=Sphaerobolus stellatus (strain SS14) TaxID=990650 RepID=A0A0C9TS91_SPHS4|nr:hypothetical protein M422DRAFT_56274 [Sphaerobolus stellatus SS14]KIJ37032.1 hypothetical protein M422DRAFT_50663 [Sphaerobolus stellatus SS14]
MPTTISNSAVLMDVKDISQDMLPSLKFCILRAEAGSILSSLPTKNLIGVFAEASAVYTHLQNMSSLKYLGVTGMLQDIPKLAQKLPNTISRLQLNLNNLVPTQIIDFAEINEYLIRPLAKLHNLTHLSVVFDIWSYPIDANIDWDAIPVLLQALSVFPGLIYIKIGSDKQRFYERVWDVDGTSGFEFRKSAPLYGGIVAINRLFGFWDGESYTGMSKTYTFLDGL